MVTLIIKRNPRTFSVVDSLIREMYRPFNLDTATAADLDRLATLLDVEVRAPRFSGDYAFKLVAE